ncbi:ABC transporter ATP-binding protein [Streptomyces cucumeris]|uniref:ABC transporter ATP-binding protein n=1 Tax=Streptomyces cucumeris TaxID=2962890 RepID=UPI003D729C01
MNADTAVAEIRELRVEVDGRVLVDGIELRALPSTVTALVGPSGSGKTTTGLALLGEYPEGARITGRVRVSGDVVGHVPQHPSAVLNPARRVGALLYDIARRQVRTLPRARRRSEVRHRVLAALEEAQLPDGAAVLRRYPHQLSGGQQQRVVLAQALLLGARVVVADEPTTGQDALTKRRIVERLAAVAARGIAVILLSHDLDVVRALADEVVVVRGGRVVESGPAERVLRTPEHPWTRRLLAADNTTGGEPAPEDPAADGPDSAVPALEVRGLTARHGGVPVLRTDTLAVHSGTTLAVVGRSGSGKTTLARVMAGLHRDHDGTVLLDGAPLPRALRSRSREQTAAVQYVFQDARAAFDEHRPVLDQVARTAVRLRGADPAAARAEAAATLDRLGLGAETVRRRPAGLSGGELQRAALARALLARPRVLVCDEITSGLDALTRRGILDLLTTLPRDRGGLALVLVTHDLDTAALATRIAVLDDGEIVEQGPAGRIRTAPRHPFTASLLQAASWRRPAAGAGYGTPPGSGPS